MTALEHDRDAHGRGGDFNPRAFGCAACAAQFPCRRPPRGWRCTRHAGHPGPCPTVPRWWNLRGRWRS